MPCCPRSRAHVTYSVGARTDRTLPSAIRPASSQPFSPITPRYSGTSFAGGWNRSTSRNVKYSPSSVNGLAAGEEGPDPGDRLLQRTHRRARRQAHLADPRRDSVADAGQEPAGVGPLQRGDLHRRSRRVPGDAGHHAEADLDPLGGREGVGRAGEPAVEEVVLGEPHLVEAERFAPAGQLGKSLRRGGAEQENAESGVVHHELPFHVHRPRPGDRRATGPLRTVSDVDAGVSCENATRRGFPRSMGALHSVKALVVDSAQGERWVPWMA